MRGQLTEDLIIAKIQQKCDIKRDPKYDHTYKLDFIIDRFREIDKLLPIGVQVTINPDDAHKQRVFLTERRKRTLVDRSIYIKVDPEVDVDSYGAALIYQAIIGFAFQRDLQKYNVLGVKIKPDVSYEFFFLASGDQKSYNTTQTIPLEGRIMKYFPNHGYGFITSDRGDFFFHISDVLDEDLKTVVLPNAEIESEGLHVQRRGRDPRRRGQAYREEHQAKGRRGRPRGYLRRPARRRRGQAAGLHLTGRICCF
jgi:cold shock CspA family protein